MSKSVYIDVTTLTSLRDAFYGAFWRTLMTSDARWINVLDLRSEMLGHSGIQEFSFMGNQ